MEKKRWFHPKVHTGWDKDDKPQVRREKVLKAHRGNVLSSARSMQALQNVQHKDDSVTAAKAGVDARYFFRLHKKQVQKAPRLSR